MSFGSDFGQKVDLTASIRNILRNYPEGTAVLKELVQNADDATASHISFCLDCRHHPSSVLADPALAAFQGPSLLIHNNAIFTEEDFKSIQRIGDSLKRTAENKGKIGRFGIGFNAVYHWTDLPSFISAKYLVLLDPQARFLPNVNPSNPGKIVDWISQPDVLERFRDQFVPYQQHGGLNFSKGPFNGTLFRLPLRTPEQASSSLLSKRSLGTEEALLLLKSLQREASAMLLFLKHIECIEIKVWHEGMAQPSTLFSCQIENITKELKLQRSFVGKIVANASGGSAIAGSSTSVQVADYRLSIQCRELRTRSASEASSVRDDIGTYQEDWEVVNQLGGRTPNAIANDPANELLKFVPWGGVAAFIRSKAPEEGADISAGVMNQYLSSTERGGQAYCFLPLPVQTQLPVMVNGFFELSSNRRDVWQAGADMTGDGRTRAEWNLSLMRDILAPCYVRLLHRLKEVLGFTDRYQQLWPQFSIPAPWNLVSQSALSACQDQKLLCVATLPNSIAISAVVTSNDEVSEDQKYGTTVVNESIPKRKGGRSSIWNFSWLSGSAVESLSHPEQTQPEVSREKHKWIECRNAVLLPTTEFDETQGDILSHCLLAVGQPFVSCTPYLHKTLVESKTCLNLAFPPVMRRALRQVDTQLSSRFTPPPSYCLFLLQYCVSDVRPSAPYPELDNLQLLPLLSDTTAMLRIYSESQSKAIMELRSMGYSTSNSISALARTEFNVMRAVENYLQTPELVQSREQLDSGVYVICDAAECDVFQAARTMIIDKAGLRPNEIQYLSHPHMQRVSNVRAFEAPLILDLLANILPQQCLKFSTVVKDDLNSTQMYELCVFLNKFWEYIPLHPDALQAVAHGPAIVPCNGGSSFLALSGLSNLLSSRKGDFVLSSEMRQILNTLGVNIVDDIITDHASLPNKFWEYVQGPSRSGILFVLDSVMRSHALSTANVSDIKKSADTECASTNIAPPFDRLNPTELDTLRVYLASSEPIRNLSSSDIAIIKKLPIFCTFGNNSTESNCSSYLSVDSYNQANLTISASISFTVGSSYVSGNRLTAFWDCQRISDHLFPAHFVKVGSLMESALLETIGVKMLRRVDYFREELVPNSTLLAASRCREYLDAVVEMLCELTTLNQDDPNFSKFLRTSNFVVTAEVDNLPSGETGDSAPVVTVYRPGDLFDPRVEELYSLLDASFFPASRLQRDELLVFLRSLGLQSTLDFKGVVSCAKSIAQAPDSLPSAEPLERKKWNRAKNLLHFLDNSFERMISEASKPIHTPATSNAFGFFRSLFGEKPTESATNISVDQYLEELLLIPWIPVVRCPLAVGMPWMKSASCQDGSDLSDCAAPADTRLSADAWFCSASKRICDETIRSTSLKRALGWSNVLDCQTVAIQLRELSANFFSTIGLTSMSEEAMVEFKQTITGLIPQYYQRLDSWARPSGSDILPLLESSAWIWVGDTFVNAEKVAKKSAVNAVPFLYQLPQDLQVYAELMKLFRIREEFSPRDYLQVLRSIAEHSKTIPAVVQATPVTKSVGSQVAVGAKVAVAVGSVPIESNMSRMAADPLPDHQLDLAVAIVTLLGSEGSIDPAVHTIYIPDNTGRLAVSTELINDDVPWLSGPEYSNVRSGCRLIHRNISSSVAERFGVKSLRQFLVNSNLNQSLFSLPESSVEAFGQSESITNRLKTILDMYPDGNPIFSELIQNADDAGAKEVKILLDENTYGSVSLLDSKMSPLQGPSLVVFNDAKFTEADFRSLARIGQGSKLEKLATTGRFGLGFSSTYHLTDTPTFVSGEHLVVFDPHCAFAPGANVNQPGLRIKFQGNSLRTMFPDQFEPYCYFGCDFSSPFQGTLFRFPLRSPSLARRSEISKRVYSSGDVAANIDQLVGQLSNHLLFLRSVRKISIYHLESGERNPILMHEAVATVSDEERTNDQTLLRYFDKDQGTQQLTNRDSFYAKLMSTADDKLPILSYRISIQIQSLTKVSVASGLRLAPGNSILRPSAVITGDGIIPDGMPIIPREEIEYLVLSGLRGGHAKRLACDLNNRHLKLVPMGAVAACLVKRVVFPHNSQQNIEHRLPSIDGQTFCFLPLPVQTQLPVHTNAYWELSSNRRDIWRGDDTKGEAKLRSDWNNYVMSDVLAPLYAKLILLVASRFNRSAENTPVLRIDAPAAELLRLIPCPIPADIWKVVALSLYPLLTNEPILFSMLEGGSYVKFSSAYLLESHGALGSRYDEQLETPLRHRLANILLNQGLAVVEVSPILLKTLVDINAVAGQINPIFVRQHFSSQNCRLRALLPYADSKSSIAREWTTDALSDVIFLLQYCFRDVSSANYHCLHGLQLVPLENGSLGTIGDSTDAPIFLANDVERKLLSHGKCSIIVNDNILGTAIASYFRDGQFAQQCNIRPLTQLDVLRLLRQFIPEHWFASDVLIVDRSGIISDEWLVTLWAYLMDGQSSALATFGDVIPMLPVCQPANAPTGRYLVKVCAKVPVIQSVSANATSYPFLSPAISAALSDLGIFTMDAQILGNLPNSITSDVNQFLFPSTPIGLLDALKAVDTSNLIQKSNLWSGDQRDNFREFVLDSIISRVEIADNSFQNVLKSLPIWLTQASSPSISNQKGIARYVSISEAIKLPPRDINPIFVTDPNYLVIRSDRDRSLYRQLGMEAEPSKGKFYADRVIPKAVNRELVDKEVDLLALEILQNFAQLERECPELKEILMESPIFRNVSGRLCSPTSLYDPHVNTLQSLLPPSQFPSQIFAEATFMLPLRSLGLNTEINCQGVLMAALTIQADVDAALADADSTSGQQLESVVAPILKRARDLMLYMDLHMEGLLQESDPVGLDLWKRQKESPGVDILGDHNIGGTWGTELRSRRWIPCHLRPPLKQSESFIMPWPTSVHKLPVAAPSQCVSAVEMWSCSSSFRISSVDVKTDLLCALLGWGKRIPGRNIALQLIELSKIYQESLLTTESKAIVVEQYFQVLPKITKDLFSAFESESKPQADAWITLLKDKTFVWTSGQFVEPARLAFKSPSPNSLTEPFLFVVQNELVVYEDLLRAVGVRESFAAPDFAAVTRSMYRSYKTQPLNQRKAEHCAGIISVLARLLNEDTPVVQSQLNAEAVSSSSAVDSSSDESSLTQVKKMDQEKIPNAPRYTLADLGDIYMPDSDGILALTTQLYYDDAPWISSSLPAKAIRYIHNSIPLLEAKCLGAKSLRVQLFAGDEIVCPEAQILGPMLGTDALDEMLGDLLAVADYANASSVHVVYDDRTFRSESLMHPGLSAAQGPAIIVFMEGPVFDSEQILQLLGRPVMLPPLPDEKAAKPPDHEYKIYPKCGKKLASCFVATDCLQVISGKEFVMFDPCGTYLLRHDSQPPGNESLKKGKAGPSSTSSSVGAVPKARSQSVIVTATDIQEHKQNVIGVHGIDHTIRVPSGTAIRRQCEPRAQRCVLVKQRRISSSKPAGSAEVADQDILRRFPDQFSSFLSLPFGVEQSLLGRETGINGTIIRMPLRSQQSPLSAYIPSITDIKSSFREFRHLLRNVLILGNSVTSGTVRHWDELRAVVNTDFELRLTSSLLLRSDRWMQLNEKGWKRSGLSSYFTKAFVPEDASFKANVTTSLAPFEVPLPCLDYLVANAPIRPQAVGTEGGNPTSQGLMFWNEFKFGWLDWDQNILFSVSQSVLQATLAQAKSLHPQPKAVMLHVGGATPTTALIQTTEEWLILSLIGAGPCKDLAVRDPYRALKLNPFVTVFARMLSDRELIETSCPPDAGRICCGPATLCVSGVSIHIEAPFIQNTYDRTVPWLQKVVSAQSTVTESVTAESDANNAATTKPVAVVSAPKKVPVVKLERKGANATVNYAEIQAWNTALLQTIFESILPKMLFQLRSNLVSARFATGFYKYWPFSSRMLPEINSVAAQSQLVNQLSRMQLFLMGSTGAFNSLDKVILPVYDLPAPAMDYLSQSLPLAQTPVQIAKDFVSTGLRPMALTPARIREVLRSDAPSHAANLNQRFDILFPLLRFAMSDIATRANEGEFQKRKYFREIAGCPLLLMADGSIKNFPRNERERLFMVPSNLRHLLKSFSFQFLHPVLIEKFSLFEDSIFLDSLFLLKSSICLVEELSSNIFPHTWKRCCAVGNWATEESPPPQLDGESASYGSSSALPPPPPQDKALIPSSTFPHVVSELLVYVLWNEILSKESAVAFDCLENWPIVPVVSNQTRILISGEFLPYVFCFESTIAEDQHRNRLKKEASKLGTSDPFDSPQLSTVLEMTANDVNRWKWASKRCSPRIGRQHSVATGSNVMNGQAAVHPSVSGIGSMNADSANESSEGPPAVVGMAEASIQSNVPDSDEDETVTAIALSMTPINAVSDRQNDTFRPSNSGQSTIAGLSATLCGAIQKLGVPVIDTRILDGPPLAIQQTSLSESTSLGRKLLNCLHLLQEKSVTINMNQQYGPLIPGKLILNYDDLTVSDRKEILLEIYKTHRNFTLSPPEIEKLKSLKLFTDRAGRGIAISECSGGVYWCSSESVLDGIPLPSNFQNLSASSSSSAAIGQSTTFSRIFGGWSSSKAAAGASAGSNSSSTHSLPISIPDGQDGVPPAILINDTSLRELYSLLGVVELTAATAIRKFTIPYLNVALPEERMNTMLALSRRWGNYRDDKSLVQALQDIPFVPEWSVPPLPSSAAVDSDTIGGVGASSGTNPISAATRLATAVPAVVAGAAFIAASEALNFAAPCRRPRELLSWTNDSLLHILQGQLQYRYVAPLSLRTPELHVFLSDLGMQQDLKSDTFLKIATDIAELAAVGTDINRDQSASYSRRLLRYLRDDTHALDLIDAELSRKLRKIAFVPVQIVSRVDAGCHFSFQTDIVSFERVMLRNRGSLAFTQFPILDDDIAPPQHFASALGITVDPKVDVVLKHVGVLTSNGETIDRWNHPSFEANQTFSDIFRYLNDRWMDLPPNERLSLKSKPLVPVDHYLVPPSRLFFRLSEDLSPFMHEVPRMYGAHEKFLKQIGVKESPSASDYSQFLHDLAAECKDESLNPNELHAVMAIIQNIASQIDGQVGSLSGGAALNAAVLDTMYIPDENSVLRRVIHCIINDDYWLRQRIANGIENLGYHFVHPSLNSNISLSLQIPSLSKVVVERLRTAASGSGPIIQAAPNESDLLAGMKQVFRSEGFVSSLFALVIDSAATKEVVEKSSGNSSSNIALAEVLEHGVAGLQARLEGLFIRFVKTLPTCLVLRDTTKMPSREIELPSDAGMIATSSSRLSFLDVRNGYTTLYINSEAISPPIDVETAVAIGLCRFLTLDSSVAATVACLIRAVDDGVDVNQVLSSLRLGRDAGTLRELLRGSPGERVLESDRSLLELKPFRVFRVGEVVAYTFRSSTAAVVAASASIGEDIRYGRVLNVGEAEEGGLRRITVRATGGTPLQLLSTEVYSFKSAREGASARANASAVTGVKISTLLPGPVAAAWSSLTSGSSSSSASSAAVSASQQSTNSGPPPTSPVDRNELMSALSGLLVRAGIPIGAETEDMMAKIIDLNGKVKRLESELQADRLQLQDAQDKLTVANNAHTCQICLTMKCDHVLVPCGHVVCGTCAAQLQKCWCRAAIKQKIKYFYS